MVKRISFLAILIAALLLGGCGRMENTESKKQNINDLALAYMEQKYGEPFEYAAPYGDSMSGTHEILASCASLPSQKILVQVENYKRDDKIFCDNYLAVKYREETIAYFLRFATDVFGDANVFYEVAKMPLSPELSANATFDEYLADTHGFISACIEIRGSSFVEKEQVQEMINSIVTSCKADNLTLIIVFVKDELFGTTDEDALRRNVVRRQFVHCARVTRENGEVQIEWLGGITNE